MAIEVWTVLWDVKSEGSLNPCGPWAEKKNKVINAAAETKEKNLSYRNVPAGTAVKSAVVQSAKLVSVEAESAEEAVLAVRKFYGYYPAGGNELTLEKILETASVAGLGPRSNTMATGKQAAGVLTEVTVL